MVGVVIAWRGLTTWRKELRERGTYEVARRTLLSLYKVRRAIGGVRAFAFSSEEAADRPEGKPGEDKNVEELIWIYMKQWELVAAAMDAFNADVLEAEVVLGGEIQERAVVLRRLARELLHNLRLHVADVRGDSGESRLPVEKQKEIENVVTSLGDDAETDPFGAELAKAIEALEQALKPHVGRR